MATCDTQPVTGDDGDAIVDGTDLEVNAWSYRETAESLDTTDKASNGFRKRRGGLVGATGTVSAMWKINKNPGSSPPSLVAGKQVTLKLEITQGGPFYQFSALITEIGVENPVDNVVSWTFNYESCGAITRPGELTSTS